MADVIQFPIVARPPLHSQAWKDQHNREALARTLEAHDLLPPLSKPFLVQSIDADAQLRVAVLAAQQAWQQRDREALRAAVFRMVARSYDVTAAGLMDLQLQGGVKRTTIIRRRPADVQLPCDCEDSE